MQIRFVDRQISLAGKTLFLSAPTTGSLPLLTLDTVISQQPFKRVAFLETDLVDPCVGYLPQDIAEGVLGLPAEFYLMGDVVILQLRSSIRFGRKREFASAINQLLSNLQIKQTVVLGALPISSRPDGEILSQNCGVYFKQKGSSISNLEFVENGILLPIEQLRDEDQEDNAVLETTGVAKQLLKECFNIIGLFMFAEDQEEKMKAWQFASKLSKIVSLKEIHLSKGPLN